MTRPPDAGCNWTRAASPAATQTWGFAPNTPERDNDPINWIDPLGTSAWAGFLDFVQVGLDGLGMIPGIGEPFDFVNAGISFLRGDCVGGFLGLAAAVPFAGWLATGGKWSRRARVCRILCFATGTTVATPNGPRPIEDLRPGDLVVARDERTGELVDQPVTQTHIQPSREIVELAVRDPQTGHLERLRVTAEHPFWRRGHGWTAADELTPGDAIATATSTWLVVVELTSTNEREPVYNITVADDHNFFVGGSAAWVHNCATVARLKNELFLKGERHLTPIQRSREALRRFRAGQHTIPKGLSTQDLISYRHAAQRAIDKASRISAEAGRRARLVQEPRIELIDEILQAGLP